jgi:hypothetical protein
MVIIIFHIQVAIYGWLVVSTPLKNMSSSVGVTIPNIGKVKKTMVPNHQPDTLLFQLITITNQY